MMKEKFTTWLKHKGLSESSINKYSSGYPNRILDELCVDIFSITDMEVLSEILVKTKDWESNMIKNPNRAYSSAVKNYMMFLNTELGNCEDDV